MPLSPEELEAENRELKAKICNLENQLAAVSKLLQQSLDGNQTLQGLMQTLQVKLDELVLQTKKRNKKDYGPKTEKHNPSPSPAETLATETKPRKKPINRNHKKHILDQPGAPIRPVAHKVAVRKTCCPTCSVDTVFVRNEISYQLEHIKSTIEKLEHQQEVRACPKCKAYVVTAEKPAAPLPGAICGPILLAYTIVSKFADGLPLYRQAKISKRGKVVIPRSTRSGWTMQSADLLQPLYDLLKRETLKSAVIKTDDTEIKIQDRQHKNGIRKGKMTPYLGDDTYRLTFFDFSPSKIFARNTDILKNYCGVVQCDAASGFDALFRDGSKIEAGCNSHGRRKTSEVEDIEVAICSEILDLYSKAYAIEKRLKGAKFEEILAVRQAQTAPLFAMLHQIYSTLQTALHPTHALKQAVEYNLKHWQALTLFLADPRVAICNNETERAIRDFVLVRKNCYFVGSDAGGKAAAIHLSFIASCYRNDIDPLEYLADVFRRINDTKIPDLWQLLPNHWKPFPDSA